MQKADFPGPNLSQKIVGAQFVNKKRLWHLPLAVSWLVSWSVTLSDPRDLCDLWDIWSAEWWWFWAAVCFRSLTVLRAKWLRIRGKERASGGKRRQDCRVNTKMFWRRRAANWEILGTPFDLTRLADSLWTRSSFHLCLSSWLTWGDNYLHYLQKSCWKSCNTCLFGWSI